MEISNDKLTRVLTLIRDLARAHHGAEQGEVGDQADAMLKEIEAESEPEAEPEGELPEAPSRRRRN